MEECENDDDDDDDDDGSSSGIPDREDRTDDLDEMI